MAAVDQTTAAIRARVDAFVDDLSVLIREAALESVNEALGAVSGAKRASRTARKAGASRKPGPKKRRGKRVSRTAEQVAQLCEQMLLAVRKAPGRGLAEIAAEFGEEIKDVRRPMQFLIADGKIRTKGQRRGMKYFAAGGGGGPKLKPAGSKAGKKKAKRKAPKTGAK